MPSASATTVPDGPIEPGESYEIQFDTTLPEGADGRYYLADYKSNWLGPEAVDYRPERLAEAVAAFARDLPGAGILPVVAAGRRLAGNNPTFLKIW